MQSVKKMLKVTEKFAESKKNMYICSVIIKQGGKYE